MRGGFRNLGMIAGLVATALLAAPSFVLNNEERPERDIGGLKLRQRRGKGQSNRRGKGAITRPKKRSNRLTISKRVRRKHRRAA